MTEKIETSLLANSNAILSKPQKKISKKSVWWRNALIMALIATNAVAVRSCSRNASALEETKEENTKLAENATFCQKEAAEFSLKNVEYRHHLNEAEGFITSIHPFYPTNVDSLSALDEKEAMKREEEIRKADAKEEKKWEDACKVLGINPAELNRLQQNIIQRSVEHD